MVTSSCLLLRVAYCCVDYIMLLEQSFGQRLCSMSTEEGKTCNDSGDSFFRLCSVESSPHSSEQVIQNTVPFPWFKKLPETYRAGFQKLRKIDPSRTRTHSRLVKQSRRSYSHYAVCTSQEGQDRIISQSRFLPTQKRGRLSLRESYLLSTRWLIRKQIYNTFDSIPITIAELENAHIIGYSIIE